MRKIRMGMVGGGRDAFIGQVHRIAAAIDSQIELVCGAFSSTPEKSKASAKDLFLPDDRAYGDFNEMIEKEAALPEDQRMDFVSIVTPNHVHAPVAIKALKSGFHVMSDKPATFNLAEALEIRDLVKETGLVYGLTHNYTGYPMVKEGKYMIKNGQLGEVRKVVVEYPQGWLATDLESTGQKQAGWRTDPSKSGACGCMGDIGTHAENLMEYMTGLKITEMCADMSTFVEGRQLDDDGNVLLKLENGAKGILHASQISVGEENGLNIRIYGEKGGLKWKQTEPNTLEALWLDKPVQILRAGGNHANLSDIALANTRLPAGHPEGYLEAFANIYKNFANTLQARLEGREPTEIELDFPTIDDGVRGMAFLEALIKSNESDQKWYKLPIV
jgi:predicted dehydrogenase